MLTFWGGLCSAADGWPHILFDFLQKLNCIDLEFLDGLIPHQTND